MKIVKKYNINFSFALQSGLLFILLNINSLSLSNEVSASINKMEGEYVIIPQSQYQSLIAIRDSIGSITGLDTLYEDRTHSNGMPYHIYIPKNLQASVDYPLVIFLHGFTGIPLDVHNGFPKGVWSLPMFQDKHQHILFIPRYRTTNDFWPTDTYRDMFLETLNDLIAELNNNPEQPNIDTTRIYLTGFSQGGMGTWNYLRAFPHKFAAAVPLSGFNYGPQTVVEAEEIKHVPIWIFNGDNDTSVEGSRMSFNVLEAAGASDLTYHEYVDQTHVIDDFAYFTEEFPDWLFSQNLNSPAAINNQNQGKVTDFKLFQNFPNPFNPTTTLKYTLNKPARIILSIYNTLGRKIKILVNTHQNTGEYSVIWNSTDSSGKQVCSGIYVYQLQTRESILSGKMLLIQ